jgi:hypothetical protein
MQCSVSGYSREMPSSETIYVNEDKAFFSLTLSLSSSFLALIPNKFIVSIVHLNTHITDIHFSAAFFFSMALAWKCGRMLKANAARPSSQLLDAVATFVWHFPIAITFFVRVLAVTQIPSEFLIFDESIIGTSKASH